MSGLIGCRDLCDSAPVNFLEGGTGTGASQDSASIDTGSARAARVMLYFATAATANGIVAVQYSDDGTNWTTCNVDLATALGDISAKRLVSLCVNLKAKYLRVQFQTGGDYSIAYELTGHREQPAVCPNAETAECAIEC